MTRIRVFGRWAGWLAVVCAGLLTVCASGPRPATSTPTLDDLQSEVMRRGALRVATDANYPPFSFVAQNGELDGFDAQVARELGQRLGVKVQFLTPDWDTVYAGNWQEVWDVHIGSMPVSAETDARFDLSRPYYYIPAVFVVPDGSPINDPNNLNGQLICATQNSIEEDYLRGNGPDLGGLPVQFAAQQVTPVLMAAELDCPQGWAAGRTDYAGWLTTPLALRNAQNAGLRLRALGSPAYYRGFALAADARAPRDTRRLLEALSAFLDDMRRDGTLRSLSTDWFGQDFSVGP